jgi:uncharacterized repeat protein (TIGR03803 family)
MYIHQRRERIRGRAWKARAIDCSTVAVGPFPKPILEKLECRRLCSAVESTLLNFGPGQYAFSALTIDASGNIYGTTNQVSGNSLSGSIYEVSPSGHGVTTLASTPAGSRAPGFELVADANRNLYFWEYEYDIFQPVSFQLFELPAGSNSFASLTPPGPSTYPADLSVGGGDVIVAANGDVFAAMNDSLVRIAEGTHALSTIATYPPGGQFSSTGALVADAAGNVYGTTEDESVSPQTWGTLFEVVHNTSKPVSVAAFTGSNGEIPSGNLVADAAGDIFGATAGGGKYDDGTIFEWIEATHDLKTLASLQGVAPNTHVTLSLGPSGNVYGIAVSNNTDGSTFAFQLNPTTGAIRDLAQGMQGILFDTSGNIFGENSGGPDNEIEITELPADSLALKAVAEVPAQQGPSGLGGVAGKAPSGLIHDANGNLFGTTSEGGTNNEGTVFEVSGSSFDVAPSVPVVFAQPTGATAVPSGSASFDAVCNSTPTPSVQWQASTDGGKTFADITGNSTATSQTLTLNGVAANANGTQYRAIFTNSLGTVTSSAATLTVVPIALVSTAHASPSSITGTTTTLSALGDGSSGETGLTYRWAVVAAPAGAASPTYSINKSNAAQRVVATFHKDGYYRFRCTISDGQGHTLATDVSVDVKQQATSLRITPHNKTIQIGQTIQYHAALYDQFGHPLRTQPTVTYSIVHGPGTIGSTSGIFSSSLPGAALIQADEGDFTGTVGVQVIP